MHFSPNTHPLAIPAIADALTLPVDLLSPPAPWSSVHPREFEAPLRTTPSKHPNLGPDLIL